MKIIKENFILLFGVMGLMLLFQSCGDNSVMFSPLGNAVHAYHFENEDTVLSAGSHEYIISMIGENRSLDWGFGKIELLEIYGDPPQSIWFPPLPDSCILSDDSASVDWISFDKVKDEDNPGIKVTVKENSDKSLRGAKISISHTTTLNEYFWGEVKIYQNPMSDTE